MDVFFPVLVSSLSLYLRFKLSLFYSSFSLAFLAFYESADFLFYILLLVNHYQKFRWNLTTRSHTFTLPVSLQPQKLYTTFVACWDLVDGISAKKKGQGMAITTATALSVLQSEGSSSSSACKTFNFEVKTDKLWQLFALLLFLV